MIRAWSKIQGWWVSGVAAVIVIVGVYVAGGRSAKKSAELDRRRKDDASRKKADAVANRIGSMDDDDVRQLADRWVRSKRR